MEEEKNERNEGGAVVVNVAIFTQGERERVEFLFFFLINIFQFFEIKKLNKK